MATTAKNTTYSGVLKGTYTSLTKTGAGTLTLSGANSYSGNTIVNAGTLLVNGPGSLAASSAVSVGAGATAATLGGDGTIYGTVTVGAKGTLAPGTFIGTLKLGAKPALNGALAMEIKPSDQTCDKLNLTSGGAFTYGGTLALQVVAGETLAGGEMFDLFDFTGASDGSFAITTEPALAANLNWWEGLLASEGKLVLNRAPTGVVDHGFTRAKGVSMKIKKADLMAGVSDPDSASGDSASFDAVCL